MTRFFRRFIGGPSPSNAVQGRQEVYDDEPSDLNAPLFPIYPPLPANWGRPYQWHEIMRGTENFQQRFYLGSGNFGRVYRCHFSETNEDGAVKIQDRTNPSTGHEEFLREVTALDLANHPNVIKFLGRCYGRRNRAIIYEFMSNGSLDRHIFVNERQGQGLDWDRRMKIAVGVAQGLRYTHQVLKVIHRDVKAKNILLDENFVPKLSDFGSASMIFVDEDGQEEQRQMYPIKGPPGWMAPETKQYWLVSSHSDVYSYGIFLFALFSGRRVFDPDLFLYSNWLNGEWNNSRYEPVDVVLGNQYSVEGLKKIYNTARMCIHPEPYGRPAMSIVEGMVLQAAAYPVQEVQRRHLV